MLAIAERAARKILARPKVAPHDLIPEITNAETAIIDAVRPYTLTSVEKIWALLRAVQYVHTHGIPGDFVELGVWRGGSSMAAALMFRRLQDQRTLWLYDTYEGMSEPTDLDRKTRTGAEPARAKWDRTRIGDGSDWCRASLDDVQANMASTKYWPPRIITVKGKAEDTVAHQKPDQVCILRIDTDWHAPTKAAMEHLYDRLSPGGVLILDDYGSWEGAKVAVDDYFAAHGPAPLMTRLDRGGRMLVKR